MTIDEFQEKFNTDLQCLLWVQKKRFPECPECGGKLYHIRKRVSFCCRSGHQVSPLVGTIFEKTRTPLNKWFLAIYLMSETRSGVSANTLSKILGGSYKTSWRMFHLIRTLMDYEGKPLRGVVEADETYIGGKRWFSGKEWWSKRKEIKQTIILGMVERRGKVITKIVPHTNQDLLAKEVASYVKKGDKVVTDCHFGYKTLPILGYKHSKINHSIHYVDKENSEIHTNTIEGFWGQMKRGLTGVYRHVSVKYLQSYCDEYAFRYSNRNVGVFQTLADRTVTRIKEKDIPF